MRFRACSLDSLRQVEAREDEDGVGDDLQSFLHPGGIITTEEDGFHRLKVVVLLQVFQDLQEELFGILVAASKIVGILEFGSP
jgi:hypothetical protein